MKELLCPFCGNNPIQKNPPLDRLREVGGNVSGVGGGDFKLDPPSEKEIFYHCKGCNKEYYLLSNTFLQSILSRFTPSSSDKETLKPQISRFYKISIDLITFVQEYNIGIVRLRHDFKSFFTGKGFCPLCICFNDKQCKRTFSRLIKEKAENNLDYFTIKNLVPSI